MVGYCADGLTKWGVLGALLLGTTLMGCAKKEKHQAEAVPKVTCKLPGTMLADLDKVKNVFEIDAETKVRWMKSVRDGCKPWPKYAIQAMELAMPTSPGESVVVLTAKPLWSRAKFKEARRQICPEYGKLPRFQSTDDRQRYLQVIKLRWTRCGLAGLGLMDFDEFARNGAVAFVTVAMHRMLVRGGLGTAKARQMVRLFLFDDPYLQMVKDAKIRLPTSRSVTAMADAVDLMINQASILCRNNAVVNVKGWVVEPNSKRDGPHGFFIDPLFNKLKDEAKKLKAAEKQGGAPFRGQALITVDGRAPYRLLAEVLYTANQAEFKKYQLSVRGAGRSFNVVITQTPRLSRIEPVVKPPPLSEPPQLTITATEYVLRFGAKGAPTRFTKTGGITAAQGKLAAFLRARLAKVKRVKLPDWAWGRILVKPTATTPYSELIQVLDALRERTDNPPGCYFKYDRKTSDWTVSESVRPACMYPHPILELGG